MNRFKLSLVAIFIIFSVQVVLPAAKVLASNDEISWSNNTPDVYESEIVSNTNKELCMGLNTSVRVGDEMFSRNICVAKKYKYAIWGLL